MSSVSGSSGGSSSSGGKHKLPKDGELDPLASDSTVSSKRARHAVVANSAFADAPLLSSFSNSASSVTLSSPSAPSPTAVSAVSAGEASAASLKSSFQSFAASLPPACSELMNVGIPQQILAMHAYLQQMPRFEHSVSVPGDDNDTQPVDPTTLPPLTQSTALAVAAAHASPDPPSISSPPPRVPIAVSVSSPLPCHPQLSSFLPFLHSTLSTLLVHLSTLKLNLQLLIPPSDDSNTFGVEIQTETLSHLTAYEDITFAALERIVVYGSNRAKMNSKVVKWPGVADYWTSVRELDEGMWLDGKCIVMECRETWMAVHDLLLKNRERLNDPRGEHRGGGGYRSMAM